MTNPGPPRPKGKTKQPEPEVEEETTSVQAAPAAPPEVEPLAAETTELDVTIADPQSDDLLKTNELPAIASEPEEPEDPNKAYLAPQVLPTPAVPDQDDSQRIVLNLPDQSAVLPPSPADVDRARRRAPTVKIPRATLAARGAATNEPAAKAAASPPVALPPAPPPAPRAPAASSSSVPAGEPVSAIAPKEPKPLLSLPSEPRTEAPPTALHVSSPPPGRKSRLPWVALAALCLGAGAFAILTLNKEDRREAASREAPNAASPATTTEAAARPAPSPLAEKPAPAPEPPASQAEPAPAESVAAPSITSLPPATSQPLAAQATTRPPQPAAPPAPPSTGYKPPTGPSGPVTGGPKGPPKPPKAGDYTPPTI